MQSVYHPTIKDDYQSDNNIKETNQSIKDWVIKNSFPDAIIEILSKFGVFKLNDFGTKTALELKLINEFEPIKYAFVSNNKVPLYLLFQAEVLSAFCQAKAQQSSTSVEYNPHQTKLKLNEKKPIIPGYMHNIDPASNYVLRINGLPDNLTKNDIYNFFAVSDGPKAIPKAIYISHVNDNEAFIEFNNEFEIRLAMFKDGYRFDNKYISLYRTKKPFLIKKTALGTSKKVSIKKNVKRVVGNQNDNTNVIPSHITKYTTSDNKIISISKSFVNKYELNNLSLYKSLYIDYLRLISSSAIMPTESIDIIKCGNNQSSNIIYRGKVEINHPLSLWAQSYHTSKPNYAIYFSYKKLINKIYANYDKDGKMEKIFASYYNKYKNINPNKKLNRECFTKEYCVKNIKKIHPFTSNKSNPFMSTKQNPFLLQKPKWVPTTELVPVALPKPPIALEKNTKKMICRNYMNGGKCTYGDKCHFIHESKPESNVKSKTMLCKNYMKTGKCTFGDQCYFIHDKYAPVILKKSKKSAKILCKNYMNDGKCTFGDKCYFSHRKPIKKIKKILCKKFLNTGNCIYGNKCHFAHDEDELDICRYFNNGYCIRGNKCQYAHIQTKLISSLTDFIPNINHEINNTESLKCSFLIGWSKYKYQNNNNNNDNNLWFDSFKYLFNNNNWNNKLLNDFVTENLQNHQKRIRFFELIKENTFKNIIKDFKLKIKNISFNNIFDDFKHDFDDNDDIDINHVELAIGNNCNDDDDLDRIIKECEQEAAFGDNEDIEDDDDNDNDTSLISGIDTNYDIKTDLTTLDDDDDAKESELSLTPSYK